jgi:hypothetical protein
MVGSPPPSVPNDAVPVGGLVPSAVLLVAGGVTEDWGMSSSWVPDPGRNDSEGGGEEEEEVEAPPLPGCPLVLGGEGVGAATQSVVTVTKLRRVESWGGSA